MGHVTAGALLPAMNFLKLFEVYVNHVTIVATLFLNGSGLDVVKNIKVSQSEAE